MKRFNWMLGAAFIALSAGIAAPASRAAVDVRIGARVPGPEGNLFFSISSQYFHRDPQSVSDWSRRFRNPDDLAVFFYIVQRSWSSAEQVYSLRMRGLPWYEVGRQCGVPFNAWYVTYDGRPSGRYSRPYRYYDRYRQDPRYAARLSDREIRDLVAVRMAHEYYGVTPETAMDWRRNGSDVQVIMTREYEHHRRDRDAEYSQYEDRDHQRPDDDRRDDDHR
jgi:hypothetical protein